MNTYHLWLHVARMRDAAGNPEGAARARRNARMLANQALRARHPPRITQAQYNALSDYGKSWVWHITKDGKLIELMPSKTASKPVSDAPLPDSPGRAHTAPSSPR